MVAINTQGIASEDDLGNDAPAPGKYHVSITTVDESFEDSNAIIVDFEVLAGTVPGQEGKTQREYFSVSEKAIRRLQRLALVTGLIQPGAPETEVSFAAGVGRQLVVETAEDSYEKDGVMKKRTKVTFMGMWSVGNANVADVPKHAGALAILNGQAAATPAAAPVPAGQPPQQAPAPAAQSQQDWSNL